MEPNRELTREEFEQMIRDREQNQNIQVEQLQPQSQPQSQPQETSQVVAEQVTNKPILSEEEIRKIKEEAHRQVLNEIYNKVNNNNTKEQIIQLGKDAITGIKSIANNTQIYQREEDPNAFLVMAQFPNQNSNQNPNNSNIIQTMTSLNNSESKNNLNNILYSFSSNNKNNNYKNLFFENMPKNNNKLNEKLRNTNIHRFFSGKNTSNINNFLSFKNKNTNFNKYILSKKSNAVSNKMFNSKNAINSMLGKKNNLKLNMKRYL